MKQFQLNSYTTFVAQIERRSELVTLLEQRLGIERQQQFEHFFSRYAPQFNERDKFVCEQMRAMTTHGLYRCDLKMLMGIALL